MTRGALRVALAFTLLSLAATPAYSYKKIKTFMPQAPELSLNGVTQIAILDLKADGTGTENVGKFISDKMISYLLMDKRGITKIEGGLFGSDREGVTLIEGVSTKVYSVVERSRLESVLAEQSAGDMGLVQGDQAAKVGELLGAQVMITGDASWTYSDKKEREVHETYQNKQKVQYYADCTTRTVSVTANIRILDVKSGQILSTKNLGLPMSIKVCDDNSKTLPPAGDMAGDLAAQIAWQFVNAFTPVYDLEEFEFDKVNAEQFKKEADDAAKLAENLELDRAFAIMKKLYDADSYNPQLMYNLGILYEATGDFAKAKELFDTAASLKDDKDYQAAAARIGKRAALIPFYASVGMEIKPHDFAAAAANPSLSAKRVKVKGNSNERFEVHSAPDKASEVIVKVPGEVLLELISNDNGWCKVKLMGGREGYIEETMVAVK